MNAVLDLARQVRNASRVSTRRAYVVRLKEALRLLEAKRNVLAEGDPTMGRRDASLTFVEQCANRMARAMERQAEAQEHVADLDRIQVSHVSVPVSRGIRY